MTGAYQFLKKYGVAIGFGTGTVLAILTYVIIVTGYPEFSPSNEELYKLGIFDFGLYTTYGLIIIACALVAIFSGMYVAKNPKESVKGLIGFSVLVILFGITYSMGDGALTEELVNSDPSLLPMVDKEVNGTTVQVPASMKDSPYSSGLQFADGLIIYGYIMMALAAIAMIFAAAYDFVKQS